MQKAKRDAEGKLSFSNFGTGTVQVPVLNSIITFSNYSTRGVITENILKLRYCRADLVAFFLVKLIDKFIVQIFMFEKCSKNRRR
jgi:hypothetical protein